MDDKHLKLMNSKANGGSQSAMFTCSEETVVVETYRNPKVFKL